VIDPLERAQWADRTRTRTTNFFGEHRPAHGGHVGGRTAGPVDLTDVSVDESIRDRDKFDKVVKRDRPDFMHT
jgi:hypothetical protein